MPDSWIVFIGQGVLRLKWWESLLATAILTHATIICVTVYLHRCQAHRALPLHRSVSHFFRFWLWMTTGIVTGPWTAIHRKHHAKCETPEDPHSPQMRGIWKVLLHGAELYRAEIKNEETLRRFGYGTPDDWMERNLYARYPDLGISLLLVADVALFGAPGASIWAIQMLWIPFWAGGVVNGAGHFTGYRNFGSPDASSNIFPLGIVIGGEELHNNHHAFATSAKLSSRWFEFDIGWMYISILCMFHLATVRKRAPKPQWVKGRKTVDEDTLQAVLSNRHEVMGRYARAVDQAYRQDLAGINQLSAGEKSRRLRAVKYRLRTLDRGVPEQALPPLTSHDCGPLLYLDLHATLAAMWIRSTRSREELLGQFQDWCIRAENSGSTPVREFALRLRQFAWRPVDCASPYACGRMCKCGALPCGEIGQQPFAFPPDNVITLAHTLFESDAVEDLDPAVAVADQTGVLQSQGRLGYTSSPHAEHVGDQFLGHRQLIRIEPVEAEEQPTA